MPIIHQETFAEQCDKLPKIKLDLETLKFIKFSFEIHSDWQSTQLIKILSNPFVVR